MYIPKHFDANERTKIDSFLRQNSFGELITLSQDSLFATHMPFLIDENKTCLLMHMAKANPHWKSIDGADVLLVVNGPHGYISPSWYIDVGVPTWNYQALHIYGKASHFDELKRLKNVVNSLTETAESEMDNPWQSSYADSMLRGIIGLEIKITDIQCKFKLSQNRSKAEQIKVVQQLKREGNNTLAEAMIAENKLDRQSLK